MTSSKILVKDIHTRWPKLNEAELANVKSHDALSALVVKGYNLDRAKADTEVTTWMAGRISWSLTGILTATFSGCNRM